MAYQITRETYGVYTAYCGFVTGAEFLESMFHNQNDPDFDRWRYVIKDLLQVTGHSIGPAHMKTAAIDGLGAELINANIKIAIVAVDQGMRDLVADFTALTHYPLGFFESVAEARVWVEQDASV